MQPAPSRPRRPHARRKVVKEHAAHFARSSQRPRAGTHSDSRWRDGDDDPVPQAHGGRLPRRPFPRSSGRPQGQPRHPQQMQVQVPQQPPQVEQKKEPYNIKNFDYM